MEPNCVSINLYTRADGNGNYKCELNNATHEGHEKKLIEQEMYSYHASEVDITFNLRFRLVYFVYFLRPLVSCLPLVSNLSCFHPFKTLAVILCLCSLPKSSQRQSISKLLEKYRNRRTTLTMMTRITMTMLMTVAVWLTIR